METKFSVREKWIYLSSALAVFSMFLPWRVFGIRSDNGWELNYFFVLIFWIFPFINAYLKFKWDFFSKISIVVAGIGLARFIGGEDSVYLLRRTYSASIGAGAYIYLVSWLLALYSEFFLSRDVKNQQKLNNVPAQDNSEKLFLQVTKDFESNQLDEALWAKCMAVCEGDSEKAKYKYIRSQVDKLERTYQDVEENVNGDVEPQSVILVKRYGSIGLSLLPMVAGFILLFQYMTVPIKEASDVLAVLGLILVIGSYFLVKKVRKIF